jgi:hypothetical protein
MGADAMEVGVEAPDGCAAFATDTPAESVAVWAFFDTNTWASCAAQLIDAPAAIAPVINPIHRRTTMAAEDIADHRDELRAAGSVNRE